MQKAADPSPALRQALAAHQAGQLEDAERLYAVALAGTPHDAVGQYYFARLLMQRGRMDAALTALDNALGAMPHLTDGWMARAAALQALGRTAQAVAACDRALTLQPGLAQAHHNRAILLDMLGRCGEALAAMDRAASLNPGDALVWNERGRMLGAQGQRGAALASYDRALALAPNDAAARNNRGALLWEMGEIDRALADFDAAIAHRPDFASALYNRGQMLWARKQRLGAAIADLERAMALAPDTPFLRGHLLHLKMYAGRWENFETEKAALDAGVRAGLPVAEPFVYQGLSSAPADLLAAARIAAAARFPAAPALFTAVRRKPGKIRLGYVCGEFRQQATMILTAGLYEYHDKDRFELVAIDNGAGDGSPMRQRLEAAFDKILPIAGLPSGDAARAVADADIDILINLNGWYGRMRMDLFARRPAPLAVNFLGFPGSLGAPYMDYLIADRRVVPPDEARHYDEKIAWLPHCYQATDDRRARPGPAPSRASEGLPQDGFVFCYFNQSYKLTPGTFASWIRILARTPGSVLWLLESSDLFADNLRRAAAQAGIAPQRLVFAPYVKEDAHLARLALADLFLDGLPSNAHTTASDALWAGLPLLTRAGGAFAGRVAASLLEAAGLGELVAADGPAYEEMAVSLALEPGRLAALRRKLAAARDTAPLFDTARYTRDLESAFTTMLDRWARGEAPQDFAVP